MDAHGIEPADKVPASRQLKRDDAREILAGSSRVIVAKGKKVSEFAPGGKAPKAVVDAMLGPTGNLRAPCARAGKTVVVGFNADAYASVFS